MKKAGHEDTAEAKLGLKRTVAVKAVDAGHNGDGLDRLVIRNYLFEKSAPQPIWYDECELTRVPDSMARLLAPGLPSGYAGKP